MDIQGPGKIVSIYVRPRGNVESGEQGLLRQRDADIRAAIRRFLKILDGENQIL